MDLTQYSYEFLRNLRWNKVQPTKQLSPEDWLEAVKMAYQDQCKGAASNALFSWKICDMRQFGESKTNQKFLLTNQTPLLSTPKLNHLIWLTQMILLPIRLLWESWIQVPNLPVQSPSQIGQKAAKKQCLYAYWEEKLLSPKVGLLNLK